MSYRLITKATLTLANVETAVDVRAYASPKGASVGNLYLNGTDAPFKLTGGQGRGSVVRCYCYFPLGNESAYIEVTRDQFTELKAGNRASIVTADQLRNLVTEPAPAVEQPAVEQSEPAPKATRRAKQVVSA
jgi:hypothetical protein